MTIQLFVSPIALPRPRRLTSPIVLRAALTIAIFTLLLVKAFAAERPVLRGDIVARADILTLGDLVDGVTGAPASHPVFRAPALGESGTIQAHRIVEAAKGLGIASVETGGRIQISVTRAARRIGAPEIEAAVKKALEAQAIIDIRPMSVVFDGNPALVVSPDVMDAVTVEDLVYDRRSRRVSALVSVSPNPGERRAASRVTGALVELVEVAVLRRSISRGETIEASDIATERRARESVPQDAQGEIADLAGRVARRALSVGSTIRVGDLARPEIVARGDVVTIVYEIPGMTLTLRGRASEAGAQGDTIAVENTQSKRTLQAQVVAPGRVSVSAPVPGPMASITQTARQ
jgi:flagella basal body P-ring formation protein FlgA